MNAHASVVESRWGRAIMSSFRAAWSGGGLVGAAFGGLLISHGASAAVQLGVEALATLAIALTASFQIGAGDAHRAGTFFALPERRLVSLGAIAFLPVFAEASVNDWSALYLSAASRRRPPLGPCRLGDNDGPQSGASGRCRGSVKLLWRVGGGASSGGLSGRPRRPYFHRYA